MVILERARLTLAERQAEWAKIASARANLLATEPLTGSTLLVPMGWQTHDTGLVVTTMWDQQVDFTYTNSGLPLWATQPNYLGATGIPILNFDQSTDWLESPDADFWDDSAATSEPSYCWAFWVLTVTGAISNTLWSKSSTNSGSGTSWITFYVSTERLACRIIDDSAGAFIGSQSTLGLADGWHHFAITKHDDGVDSASVITYVDGVADRTDSTFGTYVNQETSTTVVRIGAESDGGNPNGLSIAAGPLGPVFRQVGTGAVWTPDVILRDAQLGAAALGITLGG